MKTPKVTDIELMDKLLNYEYKTNGQHNWTAFEKEEMLTLQQHKKIWELVRHFGNRLDILKTSDYAIHTSEEWTLDFIKAGGFKSYFKDIIEREKQEEYDKSLDRKLKELQIENTERSIKFYKHRYSWMFGFALLGFALSWFSKQPLLGILAIEKENIEQIQQEPVLKIKKQNISIPEKNNTNDSLKNL